MAKNSMFVDVEASQDDEEHLEEQPSGPQVPLPPLPPAVYAGKDNWEKFVSSTERRYAARTSDTRSTLAAAHGRPDSQVDATPTSPAIVLSPENDEISKEPGTKAIVAGVLGGFVFHCPVWRVKFKSGMKDMVFDALVRHPKRQSVGWSDSFKMIFFQFDSPDCRPDEELRGIPGLVRRFRSSQWTLDVVEFPVNELAALINPTSLWLGDFVGIRSKNNYDGDIGILKGCAESDTHAEVLVIPRLQKIPLHYDGPSEQLLKSQARPLPELFDPRASYCLGPVKPIAGEAHTYMCGTYRFEYGLLVLKVKKSLLIMAREQLSMDLCTLHTFFNAGHPIPPPIWTPPISGWMFFPGERVVNCQTGLRATVESVLHGYLEILVEEPGEKSYITLIEWYEVSKVLQAGYVVLACDPSDGGWAFHQDKENYVYFTEQRFNEPIVAVIADDSRYRKAHINTLCQGNTPFHHNAKAFRLGEFVDISLEEEKKLNEHVTGWVLGYNDKRVVISSRRPGMRSGTAKTWEMDEVLLFKTLPPDERPYGSTYTRPKTNGDLAKMETDITRFRTIPCPWVHSQVQVVPRPRPKLACGQRGWEGYQAGAIWKGHIGTIQDVSADESNPSGLSLRVAIDTMGRKQAVNFDYWDLVHYDGVKTLIDVDNCPAFTRLDVAIPLPPFLMPIYSPQGYHEFPNSNTTVRANSYIINTGRETPSYHTYVEGDAPAWDPSSKTPLPLSVVEDEETSSGAPESKPFWAKPSLVGGRLKVSLPGTEKKHLAVQVFRDNERYFLQSRSGTGGCVNSVSQDLARSLTPVYPNKLSNHLMVVIAGQHTGKVGIKQRLNPDESIDLFVVEPTQQEIGLTGEGIKVHRMDLCVYPETRTESQKRQKLARTLTV